MSVTEVRIHGRGGDGSVTFAHMLALAAMYSGKYGQSCQSMTPMRRGAPVDGYARISNLEIPERGVVTSPDFVIVLSAGVLKSVNVEAGMKENGVILINSVEPIKFNHRAEYFDATTIALETMGTTMPNAVMLGAFAAWTGMISLEDLQKACPEIMGKKISDSITDKNVKAMEIAYNKFLETRQVLAR